MLVHLLESNFSSKYDDWDYDNCKILGTYIIDSYDQFIKFIKTFKDNESQYIEFKDKWYSLLDYTFKFPEDHDCLPLIKLYVCEY